MTTKTKAASAGAKAPKPTVTKPKAPRAKKADPVATAPLPHPPLAKLSPAAPAPGGDTPLPDFEALSRNAARLVEVGGKALAAYMKPMEEGRTNADLADSVGDAVKTFGKVAEYWLADPKRSLQAQTAITTGFIDLWSNALRRMGGEQASDLVPTDPATSGSLIPNGRKTRSSIFCAKPIRSPTTGPTNWSTMPTAWTPPPASAPSSICARSPAPSRPPISSPRTPN